MTVSAENPEFDSHSRHSRRARVRLNGGLRQSGGASVGVEILDLSTEGFSIETHMYPGKGVSVWLRLPGLENRHAKVAWRDGIKVGCAFEEPLHPAVLDMIIERSRAA